MNVCCFVHQNFVTAASDGDVLCDLADDAATLDCGDLSSCKKSGGGWWSRTFVKYGLVLIAYTIAVGAIFYQLLEENQLDLVIRRKVPIVV